MTIFRIIDIVLFVIMAISVFYVFLFAVVSLFRRKEKNTIPTDNIGQRRFAILYPAYKEDRVIVSSIETFLKQDYPKDNYEVIVISDQMSQETNIRLQSLPITLLLATYQNSSKAKAMQLAMQEIPEKYDFVVILDADNVVRPTFLTELNKECSINKCAFQCHRCAKNSENDIAVLDGVSEEINNSIFRRAHNTIGLSSALIGSGMCFDFNWFKNNVNNLSTSGEDKELEMFLLKQKIHIKYLENIPVFDEKVQSETNFQNQRLRWMAAQLQCLSYMLPYTFKALCKGNIDYLDKTLQQALLPRLFLIVLTLLFSIIITIISPSLSIKWWIMYFVLCLSLFIAIPKQLRQQAILSKIVRIPALFGRMFMNIFRIKKSTNQFIHTSHNEDKRNE